MASAWIERRTTKRGTSYRVKFRLGGRETVPRYAGAFPTMREAKIRLNWCRGELAALRVPDVHLIAPDDHSATTLRVVAEAWKRSRLDVSAGTMATYDVSLSRLLPRIGDRTPDAVTPANVAELVAELHTAGLRKQTIRKTVSVLAMILDHAGIEPNPARDKLIVKMPREERRHVEPPTADHIEAVLRLLPSKYRLPVLVLDATGLRVGELEALTWGDMDEPRGRWRIATSKTGRPRWVSPPPLLYKLVLDLCPRDDRAPERRVFDDVTADRLRTAIAKACTAAAVPAFSPHDLRHRRVSLMHAGGISWARIGEQVGHDDLMTTARTYTHVVADERELDYRAQSLLIRRKAAMAEPRT